MYEMLCRHEAWDDATEEELQQAVHIGERPLFGDLPEAPEVSHL